MKPELVTVESFAVTGLPVRTTNAAEQTPAAKIGPLWQQFFGSGMLDPANAQGSQVIGVYANYESDWNGAFDVLAGVTKPAVAEANAQTLQIQAGRYLVFRGKGAMPQAVIECWARVWQFFSAQRQDVQRSYLTDFEQYVGADEVAIHIGVKGEPKV